MQLHELKLRFPESVRNYLSMRAKDNDRSMNAELVNILKKVMKAEPVSENQINEAQVDNSAISEETVR